MRRTSQRVRSRALASVLALSGLVGFGLTSTAFSQPAHAATPPSGDTGTSIDPLKYNCGNDAPTCGQVGESYGFYKGANVNLLYTENYYCDPAVTSHAATKCEAGAGPSSATPTGTSVDGTTLGNTTHADTLYIPVPLFSHPPATQCVSSATCIDHPPTIDLSALAGALGVSDPTTLYNVPIPAHNHVVDTRNSGLPEWWNVEVVGVFDPAVYSHLTSLSSIQAAETAEPSKVVSIPTNAFLMFQVMPGTVPAAQAADLTATAPPGSALPAAPNPDPAVNQAEAGTAIPNLRNDCGATAPLCQNVGLSHDWIASTDVYALYSEPYFCDKSVTAGSTTGCEAGAAPNQVPPGVADQTAPSPTVTNSAIDPLYIPVPLFAGAQYTQCPSVIVCIDHPDTIDLSRLSGALGAPASALMNVPLPSHDHILTTRNGDQPEWWNVIVIPVTTPAGLHAVESAKNYTSVKALEGVANTGIGGEIATNAYLWFQTLPGNGPATPGPLSSACKSSLAAGQVVASAALPDGTGYVQTDAAGDVAVYGAATCYGALTGSKVNAPVVGIAVDRVTGGYWLAAADGGVFSFNAPFHGSAFGYALTKPVVGIATSDTGDGYWLVAGDGGVFSFNLPFHGSAGAIRLAQPVVGMAFDPATGGYWLVAADGGVFSYDATFYGSAANYHLTKPAVGLASLSDGSGYRLFSADGGVFDFQAGFFGSAFGASATPVVTGLNDNSYDGYWIVNANGKVATFGPPSAGMPSFGP